VGDKLIVCDAGGSTVDTTLYKVTEKNPLQLEEVKASDCIQAGGIFVDKNARSFFEGRFKLVDTLLPNQRSRYVDDGVEDFISNAKNNFDNTEDEVTVKVGSLKDDFSEIEVDSGDMILPSYSMASFFGPCIEQIKESLHKQIGDHDVPVGPSWGFGDSPYLFSRLKTDFGSSLVTLNDKTAKAVADGCVIWQMEQSVASRAVRFSYGAEVTPPFHPLLPHHMERTKYIAAHGMMIVTGAWSEIVKQIYSTGSANRFDFILDNNGSLNPGFNKVCELSADLTALKGTLKREEGSHGTYWVLDFTVAIRFGGTELEAFIEWKENVGQDKHLEKGF
ncbi:hypothetical protein BDV93DRAFT_590255, partial [Ceratobasidium sp. AG-I]